MTTLDAIRSLRAYADGYAGNIRGMCATAADMLEELDKRVPRWISVEERLPEDDVNVLICAVSNGDEVDSCIAMTSYTHHMHGFNIEGWHPPWQYFFFDYMITHWMPLPEPPKEATP